MKTRLRLFALLLVALGATIVANSQGEKKPRTTADYRPRTLSALTTLQPDDVSDDPAIVVHGDLLPSRVKVIYEGTTRPLGEIKKRVIAGWANRFAGAPDFYIKAYETEMVFVEDGKSYWLAVNRELLPHLEQNLKKGDRVELFLIKTGNARIDDKLEPVLLVEKLEKQ